MAPNKVQSLGLLRLVPPQVMGLFALFALFLLVELLVRTDVISRTIVAKPTDVFTGLIAAQNRAVLLDGFRTTFGMIAVAMMIELLVAFPLGYFLFRRRDFSQAYSGWLTGLVAAPIFLLYPLFLVIFGRNELTLIVMGFLPGVIPLIIHVEQGFKSVPPILLNVGLSLGVTPWQNFWKIMVPAAAPSIFTGIRLALIYTLINIVAIEYLVDVGGLGRIVADRYFRFDIPGTYNAIVAVAAISILFNWLIGRIERWVRLK